MKGEIIMDRKGEWKEHSNSGERPKSERKPSWYERRCENDLIQLFDQFYTRPIFESSHTASKNCADIRKNEFQLHIEDSRKELGSQSELPKSNDVLREGGNVSSHHPLENPGQERNDASSSAILPRNIEKIRDNDIDKAIHYYMSMKEKLLGKKLPEQLRQKIEDQESYLSQQCKEKYSDQSVDSYGKGKGKEIEIGSKYNINLIDEKALTNEFQRTGNVLDRLYHVNEQYKQ